MNTSKIICIFLLNQVTNYHKHLRIITKLLGRINKKSQEGTCTILHTLVCKNAHTFIIYTFVRN